MVDLTYAYAADIVKSERDADGDLLVYGKATGPDLDLDGQRCDPDWLKKAMPDWFMWANIREMHQPVVAGVGVELRSEGDDWFVKSKVVDDRTAKKIEAGALKGMSIGVKGPRFDIRDGEEWICGGDICEISYVDRPCNPTAKMAICKAVGADLTLRPVEADEDEVTIKVAGSVFTPSDLAKLLAKKTAPTVTKSDDDDDDKDDPDGKADDDSGDGSATGSGDGDGADKDQKKKAKKKAKADKKAAKKAAQADGVAGQTLDVTYALPPGATGARVVTTAGTVIAEKGAMAPLKSGGKPRYPIKNVGELQDAITAFGRGKAADRADIKAHIISEAKRLGRPDLIPDGWKGADADLGKADDGQKHDPSDIAAVRDGLVALINAELQELCDGEPELCDIEQLLCSLRLLMSWWSKEAAGGETDAPYTDGGSDMAYVGLDATADQTTASTPDATKTATVEATAEADADATKTTEPAAAKADGPVDENRLTELVKSAVAEQLKSLTKAGKKAAKERNKTLAAELDQVKADLAKALSLPEPGGPVLTRTAAQVDAARNADTDQLKAQAAELARKADTASDPYLAKGYRDRAAELLAKAA